MANFESLARVSVRGSDQAGLGVVFVIGSHGLDRDTV